MCSNDKSLSEFTLERMISDTDYYPVLWCMTGGGHKFQENLNAFLELTEKSIPIILIFSNAGALVANRYGFFYRIKDFSDVANSSFMIFENKRVLSNNISRLLDQGNIGYAYLHNDPSFSQAFSLVNNTLSCIVASPVTTNSMAKIRIGISDTLVTNIIVAGIKAGKKIAIFPTDVDTGIIKTKLPIKYRSSPNVEIDISICEYGAIKRSPSEIVYLPEYCVGCRACVDKYPTNFSYEEKYTINKRFIDAKNIDELSKECKILPSPADIPEFVLGHLLKR
ncbi:MAG: flavoprotein [Candidatus Hodarchaeales archaeon]